MGLDVECHLGAVERSVSSLERDGQPARAVTLSRSYATTVEDLWDAVTNGERIPRWFLPISGELEPGGRYQLEGNAGGAIKACEPLSHFALTWEFGEDVSWVEVGLSDDEAGRATAYTHPHRAPFGTLGRLRAGRGRGRLGAGSHGTRDPSQRNQTEPKPDEAAFATSPHGKALITGSSERWGQAAVAAGAELHAARAAVMTHYRVLHR